MQIGYITARVYTSRAEIPIPMATFTVYSSDENGNKELLGIRITDQNGKTELIPIECPDSNLSVTPGNDTPYTIVNVRIDHPEYNTFTVNGVQVFAGQVSLQNAEMQPTTTNIPYNEKSDEFLVDSTQNL